MLEEYDLLKLANVRPNWDTFLQRLADAAAPEPWSKPDAGPDDKPNLVLSNLVRHSFRRALHVGAVAYGENNGAETFAFCPRLRTLGLEALYLVARKTPPGSGGRVWSLDTIVRSTEARKFLGYAQRAVLPGAPSFWDDPAELILDPEALMKIDVDFEHLATNERLQHLFPTQIRGDLTMRKLILEKAIEVAVERGCENPRIAAPVFTFDSPQTGAGRVRLCLPLHLKETTQTHRTADMALVIEPLYDDNNDMLVSYQPRTLISPGDVYLQSRIFELPNQMIWPGP
jgi:hypothetical protein